ncbi:MAG: hypothetical protein GX085_10150 [Firmicutes bacterium]|nr:hypothetical protein [Bacillota bacterium]
MDILAKLKKSLELYGKNFIPIFLATLITALVSGITFGLLAGPLLGGLFLFLRKIIDGEKPELGMIFSRFDKFLPTFLVMLIAFLAGFVISIIGAIPVIGRLFSLAAGSLFSLISFMAIAYVVDKDLGPVDAVKRSIQSFLTEPVAVWIYSLAIFVISGIGALFFFFPLIFTMPFGVIGATLAYNELSAREPGALNLEKVDKKTRRIVILALAVLLVAGFIFRAGGFSGGSRRSGVGSSLTGKLLSTVTGRKVDIGKDGGSFSFGGVTFGNKIPKDFPKDVPVYGDAEVVSFFGGAKDKEYNATAMLSTADPDAKVVEFYEKNLRNKGWEIETSYLGEMAIISFKKASGWNGSVTVIPGENDTSISLTVKSSKD